ncbi:MAG TPA: PadR family transcriptional regulator [Thermoleophilaceae bacterium]
MKYAVLGLLVERRGYAYDIARRFEDTVGPAFHVHYGAIYQALDALERDALIRGALREHDVLSERRRRTGPRVVYETTDEGLEAYEEWIRTPARVEPLRGELALKVALSRPEHGPALLTLIDDYERACLERLKEHAAAAEDAVEQEGAGSWRLSSSAIARERATRLLNAEIEWVRDLRRSVTAMGARPGG